MQIYVCGINLAVFNLRTGMNENIPVILSKSITELKVRLFVGDIQSKQQSNTL